MAVSVNGWTIIPSEPSALLTTIIAGGRSTAVRVGDVATVLGEAARRFHVEVEPLTSVNGWRSAATNANSGGIPGSNHLSGTAIDLNGGAHPRYHHGSFTTAQVVAIRKIVTDLGCIRWGGDWNGDGRLIEADADEMHFEIVASPAAVKASADRIRQVSHPVITLPNSPFPGARKPLPAPPEPILEEIDMEPFIVARSNADQWYLVTPGSPKPFATPVGADDTTRPRTDANPSGLPHRYIGPAIDKFLATAVTRVG